MGVIERNDKLIALLTNHVFQYTSLFKIEVISSKNGSSKPSTTRH